MFKIISILVFFLLLDFNLLDSQPLPQNQNQKDLVQDNKENETGDKEYIVYVDDLEEGAKTAPERNKQINAEVVGGQQQGNVSYYDFGEVDKNGNYVGYVLSDDQIKSLKQQTDQAFTDAKSEKADIKQNKDQEYYQIEELGDFDLKNKKKVKNEEPIDSQKNSEENIELMPKEKQINTQKEVYEIDPVTLKRTKIRDSYYSLLNTPNERVLPLQENMQDKLSDKSDLSITSHKQQRNERPKKGDSKSDSEYYEEYEYELSTTKSTTDNSHENDLNFNPGLDHQNEVEFKQLSGVKGRDRIKISKVSDKISKGKGNDKVKYRETVLQPKRESRVLARYKVIIPVIVPNLRIRVPVNEPN